ncbi:MAG: protein kinase [Terrimicrobiaceae bacterium]|nr:protein kinase [Terrimicrobiaceae bacterium]
MSLRFQHFEVSVREDGSPEELGRGAMGITYKAFDTNLRCHVALKVINGQYLQSDVARQRFFREARAAAALRHPNVATVFHLGEEEGTCFYAMEFVDGETVESLMKRTGAIPAATALEIVLQVSRALGAAHKQGLVHRDIKPSNLMIVREDESEFTVKVIDFGLAKNATGGGNEDAATVTLGGFLGTPHFASPEQLEERELDVRSDIYSLGITLYYMLAGRAPFSGSIAQVMSQHLHREAPLEAIGAQPEPVLSLLRRMLAKDPVARPQTPTELRHETEAALAAVRNGPPTAASTPTASAEEFETCAMETVVSGSPEPTPGSVFAGRFQIMSEEPANEFGRNYLATDTSDGTSVGIVVLDSARLSTAEAFTRLEERVLRSQRLRSPAARRIIGLERADTFSFLVVEPVAGPTLLDMLRSRRAFPLTDALPLLRGMAGAFDEMHGLELPCPDLALHEIVVADGHPKFLPLELDAPAPASADATLVASPAAALKNSGAFRDRPVGAFVYSLASLTYEILGGVRSGGSGQSFVPIPALSESTNAALRKAMNPETSNESCMALVEALERSSQTSAPKSPPPVPPAIPAESQSRKPAAVLPILGAVAILLLLMAAAGAWYLGHRDRNEPELASAATPTPITPVATPTPTPEPTPSPTPDPLIESLARIDDEAATDPAKALATLVELRKSNSRPEVLAALDAMLKNLASRADSLAPGARAALVPSLTAAAEADHIAAQTFLADELRETDPAAALKWFTIAGDNGDTSAMIQAGQMLASGRGVAGPDPQNAVPWFQKAAAAGDPMAMFLLAECHLLGLGVPENKAAGVEWLEKSAELGSPLAMNTLGDLAKKGIPGVLPANPAKAFELFSKASELGLMDARGNLGVLYMTGFPGLEPDPDRAVALFREGVEADNPACMYFYAVSLERGLGGLTADTDAARAWYVKAAGLGNGPAREWCRKKNIPFENDGAR